MKITINLLPPEKKEKFGAIKKIKSIFRVYAFIYLAIFVFSSFLISCLFIIEKQMNGINEQEGILSNSDIYKRVSQTQQIIEEYHSKVIFLDQEFKQSSSYYEIFDNINKVINGGIFLTELDISSDKIFIKGFSETRDNLVDFSGKLKQFDCFKYLETPISNFVSNQKINFELTVNLDKKITTSTKNEQ